MENSVSNSDVPGIPTKSKSLDIQSLYGEKSRASEEQVVVEGEEEEEEEGKVLLKRKRRSSVENKEFITGQVKKRRRSRKEVSLSSFESISKQSNEGLNAVDELERKNSKKKKNGQVIEGGSLQNSSSLVNIAGSFDGNGVPIPKKPRGLSRRKKFQKDHLKEEAGTLAKVREEAGTSAKVSSSDAQTVKLTDDVSVIPLISSEEGKQKKISDGHEENSSGKVNSAPRLKSEDGASVRHNGDSVKKRVRRNRRKEKKSEPQKQNSVKDFEPSVDNSSVALPYDDEENLEENAARMLSSRFDPSCTGFSGNCTASASPQSPNDLSFMPSYHGDITRAGVNQPAGSESNSADAAGRVLRPRKKHKVKGHVRKRRHFYEIFFRDLDAYWVLNRRIKVFWPLDQSWYFGLITNYDPETNLHHVKYDDRDEEWISLQTERFKLLLLPSEVPCKSGSKHSRRRGKLVDDEKKNIEPDDNYMNFTDSETIISWLNRSLKSSQLGIKKKRKTSHASGSYVPTMCSDDSIDTPLGRIIAGPSRMKANNLSRDTTCSKDRKPPFVYYRRRFRKNGQGLGCISKEGSGCRKVTGSVSFFSYGVDELGATEEYDIVLPLDPDNRLWSGENFGLLKFTVPLTELEKVTLKIRVPLPWSYNRLFGARHVWVHQLLFQHGMMVTAWPKIRLEMLFVDNIVGLRFLLFEGCLMQAVALVCLVLATFRQPHGFGKFVDLQLPVTSIRFKFSGSLILERQLVFVIYNFSEVQASRWQRLDGKLKQHCSVAKHLPLAECTFDNIKIIQSGSNQLPFPSVCREPVTAKGSRRRSRQGIVHMGVSRELANNMDLSSSRLDAKLRRFPPFVLSFTAAPSFFLSLHLKLLMEKNVASNSLQNHHPISLVRDSENCGRLMGSDFSLVNNRSDQINLENNMRYFLSQVAAGSGFLSGVKSKVEIDALSISNGGDWIKSSNLNSEFNVTGTSVGGQDSGKNENHGFANLQRLPCHQSGSEQRALGSSPSVSDDRSSPEKSETGRFSHFNGITVQIPPCNQFDSRSFDRGSQSARQPISNSEWNMNDCVIRSPNPTGPRSVWHRNRHNSGSSSFGHRSKLWPDGRPDPTHNDLVNGSRKPRTQIPYLLPFGGYDVSSKPRSHSLRKGRTFSIIRDENEKMPNRSKSPRRNLELLSCDANILITEGDRGWRECGARVVLEFVDHKDWRLLVKLSGVTKYSYKAYQFLQPGTTNRHTHVMMWKGGKDWILEFPDRSQWTRFKEMHEECYNRNIRVASVKTIPIPGVRLIEEGEDAAVEVPFVRNCPKYYRQVETGVEMALNPSRVLYDLDSDDEEWIYNCRNSSDSSLNSPLEISEEMFERTMDMFEKIAYAQQRDDFTEDEIEEFIVGVGSVDVVKAIFEHWKQKRKRKSFPLIRHLQPPLWEKYQQQVKEWEKAMNNVHNFQNGCKEKTTLNEKPPMFAFCLRPRGLEVPNNKGSKHRSHRRLTTGGHNYGFYRDQDGLHNFGRRTNGFEDRGVGFFQNHEYSDASPWLQTSTSVISPQDAAGSGYLSMSSSDGSERNQRQRFHKNKVRKIGTFLSPRDSQMMAMSYNQRTGKRNGCGWNMSLPEWPSHQKQYHQPEGFQRLRAEQLDCSDLDEFRLRDASGAAQHASNMAKLKREKAQRLLYRADLAIHKATVALMIAEAIKTASSERESDRDSSEDE